MSFATILATRNKVDGMGYRELHQMEIEEVLRRWRMKESQRAIARATGLARETVKKYLAAAIRLTAHRDQLQAHLRSTPPATHARQELEASPRGHGAS